MSIKRDTKQKPPRCEVIPHNIPEELRILDRWVVWSWKLRNDKWQKPPLQVNEAPGQSNNPETWTTFERAFRAYESGKFDGVGIVLPDNVVGIDLDNARNPVDGSFTSDAQMFLAMAKTYTEVSPSGEGLKSICFGHLTNSLRNVSHERGVEIYAGGTTNRYFTITGNIVDREHSVITGQREALYSLQCMINDPVDEIFRPEEADLTPDLVKAKDYLNHLKPHRACEYSDWLKVGMALHSISEDPILLQMWEDWSSQSPSYAPGDGVGTCTDKWNSFHRDRAGRIVSLGTLQRMAKEDGYRENQYCTRSISLPELLAKKIERTYLIEDMLVENEPMIIGGASKTLKTTVMLDMLVSLAMGDKFLGTFPVPVPRRVLVISGESGEATIKENLEVLLQSRYPDWNRQTGEGLPSTAANLYTSFILPKLDDALQVDDLIRELREKSIRVVALDPLYRSLRCGDHASNVYAMGEQLELISTKLLANGITVILAHHFRKQGRTFSESPELEDLSMSGVAEFGRQFLLLKRRKQYEMDGKHDIWFSYGGSAGHQGLKVLQAYTGTRSVGIEWNATLLDVSQVEAEEARLVAEREERDRQVAETAVLDLIPYDKPRAKKAIKEDLGMASRHKAFNQLMEPLIRDGRVSEHSGDTLVRNEMRG